MIVLNVVCHARVHDTQKARREHGCCCPYAWGVPSTGSDRPLSLRAEDADWQAVEAIVTATRRCLTGRAA